MYSWSLIAIVTLLPAVENKGSPTWPYGEYTLLKPRTGCPDGWDDKGYLYQDTIDKNPSNSRSETLHIDGEVASSHVKRYFCRKTTSEPTHVWPQGQYCVYVDEEETLYKMTKGSVIMYHREDNNENILTTFFKFITKSLFEQYVGTSLYFACKTNGNKKIPISLPITKPFYLLPYGSRDCQQVEWMVATSEWIKYHTDNYKGYRYSSYTSGTVPFHELGRDRNHKGITMYYCYYEKCKNTLKAKKGVFQSPGFPGKYPDGQLCSWRIIVPTNYTVNVHFTNFSLCEKDTLKYSKRINGKFSSWYTIRVSTVPFTLKSDSDVRFVFRSDESNNSTGFGAEYRVFIPQATTTAAATFATATATTTTTTPTPIPTPTTTTTTTITATEKPSTVPVTTPSTLSTTTSSKSKFSTTKPSTATTIRTKPSTPRETFQNKSSAEAIKDSPLGSRNKAIIVMVIPAVCLLVGIVLLIIIIYQYRIKKRSSRARNAKRGTGAERDCSVMNPTYERGTIPLSPPNETAKANIALNGGDVSRMYRTLSRDTQEYEDVECKTLNKGTPNGNPKISGVKNSGYVEDGGHNPLYHVAEVCDPKKRSCVSQSEPRESEDVKDSGPNPLYHVKQGPAPNNGLSEDQSSSAESRKSEVIQDSGPNPLYCVLEGPDPNNGLGKDQSNSESRESEAVQDSGPNPLYCVLEGPDPNNGLGKDQSNSESRESEAVQDSAP